MSDLFSIRGLALASVVVYFIFDLIDSRRVKDEREELIQLKSLELAHKVTLITLTALAFGYVFLPWLDGLYIIQALILAALYTEIFGKIFYRSRL